MRHLIRFALLAMLACSMACGPVAEPKDSAQTDKPTADQPKEPPVNPIDDIEKDEVDLDNLDKPLIGNPK